MNRSIIHVDMDAFYASIEIRDHPELEGLPVVVGGDPSRRGVVAAASYAARQYGVHSAMASKTAARLCPELVFVPARHGYYAEVSRQIHAILERYTPLIEPLALDEAFLDVTASRRLWGDAAAIARRIKSEIRDELRLTASVGIAPNKFLAKLASDLGKPDGFIEVEPQQVQSLLDPLPVGKIWGVGRSGKRRLARLGITTVGQLRDRPVSLLEGDFGVWGRQVWQLAHGRDRRKVVTDGRARSISHETTFAADIADPAVLSAVLLDLTEQVAIRLRRHRRSARTVQVKVRFADFRTLTRANTMPETTSITREIWHTARALLSAALARNDDPVRLLGIGLSGLDEPRCRQADLFDDQRVRQRRLDRVADRINRRFGARTLHRGLKG